MKKFLLSLSVSALVLGLANAGEFELDKTHTSVNFKIKHMQVSNVRGSFKEFEATKIDFDTTTNKLNAFEAVVKSASIDTANDKRDTHLKAPDFFDSAKFVDIKFVAKNITDEKQVTACLKAGGNCGSCLPEIRGLIKICQMEAQL